jgi:hypothetical protein
MNSKIEPYAINTLKEEDIKARAESIAVARNYPATLANRNVSEL